MKIESTNCLFAYSPDTRVPPVQIDGLDGRWWHIHSSTADQMDIPEVLILAVANDSMCMAALKGGAHVWVKEEGVHG